MRPVASTRVQLWRGRGRHQGAAARNKTVPFHWTTTLALYRASWVPAKSVQNQRNYVLTKIHAKIKGQQYIIVVNIDTVFVSLFELVEALHRLPPRRLTATQFSMRLQQKLDKLCRGYKLLHPRLTKYCRGGDVSPVALTPMAGAVCLPSTDSRRASRRPSRSRAAGRRRRPSEQPAATRES